jgi:hypothetical protein
MQVRDTFLAETPHELGALAYSKTVAQPRSSLLVLYNNRFMRTFRVLDHQNGLNIHMGFTTTFISTYKNALCLLCSIQIMFEMKLLILSSTTFDQPT